MVRTRYSSATTWPLFLVCNSRYHFFAGCGGGTARYGGEVVVRRAWRSNGGGERGVLLYDPRQIAKAGKPATCRKCQRFRSAASYRKRQAVTKAAKKT